MGGACGTHGGKTNAHRMMMENLKERDYLEKLMRRWEDDLKWVLEQ